MARDTDMSLPAQANQDLEGDGQLAAVTCLTDPRNYPGDVDAITQHDTHISMIFLAGPYAYKLKRAVKFAYLDFSTLAKRYAACLNELRLNRRTAPSLYLGLRPIRQDANGKAYLGELLTDAEGALENEPPEADDAVIDYAVVMKRFDQDALLSHLAETGGLTERHLDALADAVARFHESAAPVSRDPVAGHRKEVADNTVDLHACPDLLDTDEVTALDRSARAMLDRDAGRLQKRAAKGLVRQCHGDLHLRNIALLDKVPTLFDAIEFSDDLAQIDVMYDLAFLLMDLEMRGLRWAANRVLNRYFFRRDDLEGLAALPLWLSLRAAIRAKVSASTLPHLDDPAARERAGRDVAAYFAAAQHYLHESPPCVVAVGGVSGTGKTTVARALAPDIGMAPGAVLIRSDVERKRIYGVEETERLPEAAYQGRINAQTYEAVHERARRALAAGHSVVLEATFLRREDRAALRRLAENAGVAFAGVWLTAPAETLKARVSARTNDASDATARVVAGQLERAPKGPINWPSVDASQDPRAVIAEARAVLRKAGIWHGGMH